MHQSSIRMLTLSRGLLNADPGQLLSLPSDQAAELVAGGYATTEGGDDGADGDANDKPKPARRRKAKDSPSGE